MCSNTCAATLCVLYCLLKCVSLLLCHGLLIEQASPMNIQYGPAYHDQASGEDCCCLQGCFRIKHCMLGGVTVRLG